MVATALSAAALLAGGQAAASETKTYPGSFCTPGYYSEAGTVTAAAGKFKSNAQFGQAVVCPIVKSVSSDPKIDSVTMNIVAAGASGAPTCTLYAMNAIVASNGASNIRFQRSGTVSGDRKTITFSSMGGGLNPPPNPFNDFFYYQINCTLRNGDTILDYKVQEAGSNTDAYKIYPPSMCRANAQMNSSIYFFNPPSSGSAGGYLQARTQFSDNSGTMEVVCPVVTDHVTTNATGTAVATIVMGRPNVNTFSIGCSFYVHNNFTAAPIDSNSTGPMAGNSSSIFPTVAFNIPVDVGVTGARYHFRCTAPASGDAKINGYKIQENP
jgi:hypothetical protein